MSTKTTGRRTPLSLSGTSTGKMNQKPPTTSNLIADNNRNSGAPNQKTESDKTIKDIQQKEKKTPSPNVEKKNEKSSSQAEENIPQNGVSNGSGTPKNQSPSKSEMNNENKSKHEKTADKANKLQSQQGQKSMSNEKEKVIKKADVKDDNSGSRKSLEIRVNKPDSINSSSSESAAAAAAAATTKNESAAKKLANDDNRQENKIVTENSVNEKTNGASTPTRNRKKLESTPDPKSKQVQDLKSAQHGNKSSSTPSTPKKFDAKEKSQTEIPTIEIFDDVEMMEPLVYPTNDFETAAVAASTPGKIVKPKDGPPILQEKISSTSTTLKFNSSPERKPINYGKLTISGRRSIRPIGDDYQPIQGYYRKTNTDFDATSTTNTSLNVTVGSEVANNSYSSFSFFGHGRKRDRNPTNSRSELELMEDNEASPKSPKRARVDVSGFFSAVASPLTKLRARFSRASIQSSTPVKQKQILAETINEVVASDEKPADISLNDNDVQFNSDIAVEKEEEALAVEKDERADESKTSSQANDEESQKNEFQTDKQDLPTSGTQSVPLADSTDDMVAASTAGEKKKGNCIVM